MLVLVIDDSQRGWLRVDRPTSCSRRPAVRPVVLADIDNPDEFLAAVIGGVGGFCRTDASVDAIVRTIQSVYDLRRGDPARHGRCRSWPMYDTGAVIA